MQRILFVLMALMAVGIARAEGFPRETANPTPLDRYVAQPDAAYRYELVDTVEREGWTGYTLKMVSQEWLTAAEVDRPLWEHFVTLTVPDEVKHQTAFLYIGGGSNESDAPKGPGGMTRRLAVNTGAIAVELGQVPNQPLTFTDDGKRRSEDSMIAYTWDKYMRTGDAKWPARLPMTKAVVRCMDTVQAFCKAHLKSPVEIKDFVVAGGSKRGWTTWTTAIVDTRVKAIIPIVIDLLNIVPSFRHHYEIYGFWAPAINDYLEMDIMSRMETPEYAALMQIVEPYSYRDRLTLPKYIMNAGSDEFFLPDSSRFYWHDLSEPKRLRYVPNSGHGLVGPDVLDSMEAFLRSQLEGFALPDYAWSFPDERTIRMTASSPVKSATLWQAVNEKARDFRFDQIGKAWTATPLEADAEGGYVGSVDTPATGWKAYMVEFAFDVPGDADIRFTSPVRVTPDTTVNKYVPEPNPAPGFLTAK